MHVCVCENIYVFKLFFISFARELSVTLVVLKDQLFVFFKLLLYAFDLFKVFLDYCFPFGGGCLILFLFFFSTSDVLE